MKKYFILLCLLTQAAFLFSQNPGNKNIYFLEASPRIGRIIPNGYNYRYLFQEHAYGLELKFGVQSIGKQAWQQHHAFPRYGLAFRYMNFTMDEIGEKYALFGYLNAPIYSTSKFSINYQFGAGMGIYPRPHNKEKNPGNIWIGSPISFYIDLEVSMAYQITKRLELIGALQFTHSSNGSTRQPNLGLNLFSQQLGLRYYLKDNDKELYMHYNTEKGQKENSLVLTIAPSIKQSPRDKRYYFASTLGLSFERQFTPCLKFGGGFDLSYNPCMQSFRTDSVKGNSLSYVTPAVKASFEVMYGRLAIYVAAALYLYRSFDYYTPYYEKAGVRLYLNDRKNQFIGVFVKAHGGSVDYIEWTYGIKLFNW